MAINFGENISNTLGQTLNRNQQATQQMLQLKRLLQRDQFNRQMRGLAQKMREKKFQLEREKFERTLINDILTRERQREQDALSKRATEKRIENLQSLIDTRGEESEQGGVAPESLISAMQSLLRVSSTEQRDASSELSDKEESLQRDLREPSTVRGRNTILAEKERTGFDEGIFDFTGVDPERFAEAKAKLDQALADSTSASEKLGTLEERKARADENVDQIRNTLQGLLESLGGVSSNDNSDDLPTITSMDEFNELTEGDEFIADGEKFVKQNGKMVRVNE